MREGDRLPGNVTGLNLRSFSFGLDIFKADHCLLCSFKSEADALSCRGTGHRHAAWHPGLLCRLRSPTAGSASPRSWAGDRDVARHWQPPQCSWGAGVFHPREAEARGPNASGSPRSPFRVQCTGPDAKTSQSRPPPSALTRASQASPQAPVPERFQTMRAIRARGQSLLTLHFPTFGLQQSVGHLC